MSAVNLLPKAELADLAKYRACELADGMIQITYLVSHGEWDRLALALGRQRATIDVLAGITSQLLPMVPTCAQGAKP